jgi:hypothetical protein
MVGRSLKWDENRSPRFSELQVRIAISDARAVFFFFFFFQTRPLTMVVSEMLDFVSYLVSQLRLKEGSPQRSITSSARRK